MKHMQVSIEDIIIFEETLSTLSSGFVDFCFTCSESGSPFSVEAHSKLLGNLVRTVMVNFCLGILCILHCT